MDKLIINGGKKLGGEITVQGAKNGALPILAATLAIDGECIIHNCPDLSDVTASIEILRHFGCKVKREGATLTVNATQVTYSPVPNALMQKMRSSIIFLGALLARFNKAQMCLPGGCELGTRPIDMHLSAFSKLGVAICETESEILCDCDCIRGGDITLKLPSVGVTENIMIGASLACGKVTVHNCACEPEIENLAEFLNSAGAKISGAGTSTVVIEGVSALHGCEHTVLPDRIATATYMSAIAVSGGSAVLNNIEKIHLSAMTDVYLKMGCDISFFGNALKIIAPQKLRSAERIVTGYYPAFATDAGPIIVATSLKAKGVTTLTETVFDNRFAYLNELTRFGAKVSVCNNTATVVGTDYLHGANVKCTDLRAGASLIITALMAEGITEIENIYHIDRGYENPEKVLAQLGANIRRV